MQPRNNNDLTKIVNFELDKRRKEDLKYILQAFKIYSDSKSKKPFMIAQIASKLYHEITEEIKCGRSEDEITYKLCERVDSVSTEMGRCLRMILNNYFRYSVPTRSYNTVPSANNQRTYSHNPHNYPQLNNIKHTLNCNCNSEVSKNTFGGTACTICGRLYHQLCLRIPKGKAFECPFCYLATMEPPSDVVETLWVGYLRHAQKKNMINFMVNKQWLLTNDYKVQLRCCRLDGVYNYEMSWPDAGEIHLNDLKIMEWKPLVTNSSLKKRKDTVYTLRDSDLQANNRMALSFQLMGFSRERYRITDSYHVLSIVVVRKLDHTQLVDKIKKSVMSQKEWQQLANKQFQGSDSGLFVEELKLQMKCVWSMTNILTPVRGFYCTHIRCLDLENTLLLLSNSKSWKCPMCNERMHRIRVDPVILKIIQSQTGSEGNILEVKFKKDLTYELVMDLPSMESESEDNTTINRPKDRSQTLITQGKVEPQLNQHPTNFSAYGGPNFISLDQQQEAAVQQEGEEVVVSPTPQQKSNDDNIDSQHQPGEMQIQKEVFWSEQNPQDTQKHTGIQSRNDEEAIVIESEEENSPILQNSPNLPDTVNPNSNSSQSLSKRPRFQEPVFDGIAQQDEESQTIDIYGSKKPGNLLMGKQKRLQSTSEQQIKDRSHLNPANSTSISNPAPISFMISKGIQNQGSRNKQSNPVETIASYAKNNINSNPLLNATRVALLAPALTPASLVPAQEILILQSDEQTEDQKKDRLARTEIYMLKAMMSHKLAWTSYRPSAAEKSRFMMLANKLFQSDS